MDNEIRNLQNEILLVGCFYKNPDFYVEYGEFIKSKYDFSDEMVRFFYDNFEIMYKTFSQTVNEEIVNTYMTQDSERFKCYRKYQGFKTVKAWMELANIDDFKNYLEIIKKYSLLREYNRQGFNVAKIMNHPKFDLFKANDIYKMIRAKADKVNTVILTNNESVVLNKDSVKLVNNCLIKPNFGLPYPYPITTELFRGIRDKNMVCYGMLSNEGKTRFMTKLVAYISLVLKEKVQILLNEMTEEELHLCLLTTVINNEEFKNLHGIDIEKCEKEISMGLYKDNKGEFIYRKVDKDGNFEESEEDYIKRVYENSEEYRKVVKISEWIEKETKGLILVKDVSADYSDKMLEFEIRKSKIIHNVKYFFYDTLKNSLNSIGDWAALKITVTKLKELANNLGIYLYGSIQLTDDTVFTSPFELSSNNISNCKQLKHLLDQLNLMKRLPKDDYYKYRYINQQAWGEANIESLNPDKIYYCCVVDKNRQGEKKILLFEADLNLNTWYELGELVKAS